MQTLLVLIIGILGRALLGERLERWNRDSTNRFLACLALLPIALIASLLFIVHSSGWSSFFIWTYVTALGGGGVFVHDLLSKSRFKMMFGAVSLMLLIAFLIADSSIVNTLR